MGKNLGDDLAEGKPTLPLIYVMENGTAQQRDLVRSCIENGDEQHFDQILSAINGSGALDYTRAQAEKAAQRAAQALDGLPASAYKTAMLELAAFAVERNH